MRRLFAMVIALATMTQAEAQVTTQPLPNVTIGRVERLSHFPSRYVEARDIDVWLPPDYSADKRYQVLYMQDGQMLFDPTTSWNKQAWNVHLNLAALMERGEVADTLIVAIPNAGKYRYSEYFPKKYLASVPPKLRADYVRRAQHGKALSDAYLRFVVKELKPAIDKRFSTRPEAASTFIMGSSMGGMMAVYALCEYPQVFGGAAAMSTHWVGKPSAWGTPEAIQNTAFPMAAFRYLQQHLPAPATHRLYMDHGTTGLDVIYGPHQSFVDEIVREAGYSDEGADANWQSRVFEGTGHTEKDWSARLDIPLQFLLAQP
jgi:predicted alpha/beta superfamily hydrolase